VRSPQSAEIDDDNDNDDENDDFDIDNDDNEVNNDNDDNEVNNDNDNGNDVVEAPNALQQPRPAITDEELRATSDYYFVYQTYSRNPTLSPSEMLGLRIYPHSWHGDNKGVVHTVTRTMFGERITLSWPSVGNRNNVPIQNAVNGEIPREAPAQNDDDEGMAGVGQMRGLNNAFRER